MNLAHLPSNLLHQPQPTKPRHNKPPSASSFSPKLLSQKSVFERASSILIRRNTMSELRQRPSAQREEAKTSPAFANIAADDGTAMASQIESEPNEKSEGPGLTALGRITLFIGFPFCVGSSGLYMAYLRTVSNPEKKIDFDNDFIFPFLLALTMVLVVGFQTGGYVSKKAKPLVAWPQVKRRKKVVYKTVIVDDEEEDEKED
jgi:hypothetical protein